MVEGWYGTPPFEIADSELDEVRRRFGFFPGFGTPFLRSQIDDAALLYFAYTPEPTAAQRRDRLRRIGTLADALLRALGAGVEFPDIEPPGIRRPLIGLRDAAGRRAAELDQAQPERGRQRKHGTLSFVLRLQRTFLNGTGKPVRYTWDEYAGCYRGGLVEFIEAVAPLCGIAISNSAIGKALKELARAGKLYEE
jgi:hypothetical protein